MTTSLLTTNDAMAYLLSALVEAYERGDISASTAHGSMVLRAVQKRVAASDTSLARTNPVQLHKEARTVLRTDDRRQVLAACETEAPTLCGGFDEVEILPPTLEASGPDTIIDSAPEDTAAMKKETP